MTIDESKYYVKSEDCISRQDAINIVVKDILSSAIVYGRTEEGMAARKAIIDGLKRLPPVTPAEKVGQWIKKEHEICFTCNQCWVTNASGVKYNYCPNCGVKMQKVVSRNES